MMLRVLVPVFVSAVFALPAISQDAGNTLTKQGEIKSAMENQKISVDFENRSIDGVIKYINSQVPFNLIMDPQVKQEMSPDQRKVTVKLDNVSVRSALKIILNMKSLGATFRAGTVSIVPESVAKKPVRRFYDIRDLMFKLRNFPGPKLELSDPEDQGGGTSSDGGGFLGGSFTETGDDQNILRDSDRLIRLIKENTGSEGDWEASSDITIQLNKQGILVVRQSEDVQKQIRELIDQLRQFR